MGKIFYVISMIMFFVIGVLFGMVFQQLAVQATFIEVASNLEDVEINIDINETKMVNDMSEFFKDIFEMENESEVEE